MRRFDLFGKKNKENGAKDLVPFGGFDIENIFESSSNEPFGFGLLKTPVKPELDVYEKGNNVVVKADLPGMDKKDIDIHLDNGILTVSGNKKQEREVKKDNYYRLERSYGIIQRAVRLPEGVKEDQIKASYKDGVLTLEIPKTERTNPDKGKRINIE